MNTNNTTVTKGGVFVALSALGYATNPIMGKVAYQAGANALTLGSIRFLAASALLWTLIRFRREGNQMPWQHRLRLLALGAFGMGMAALLYFTALEHIGASLATGLFYTYPALVTAVGAARGETVTRTGLAGLALTAAGTWLLLGSDLGGFNWGGAALILAASGVYTAYMLAAERWTATTSPFIASAHVTTGAAVFYLLAAVITLQPLPGAQAYAAGVGLAFCSTVFALITFFAGLRLVGSTRAAIISNLEPVFTTVMAVLFLHERVGGLQFAGISIVVVGAVAAQWRPVTPQALAAMSVAQPGGGAS